jgi:hypothetical protein
MMTLEKLFSHNQSLIIFALVFSLILALFELILVYQALFA